MTPVTSLSKMGVDDGSTAASANRRAENAEREATQRIQAAERNAQRTEAEQEQNLSVVRDQYQKQFSSEEAHQEALLESQRMKGYQNIRNLQRSQNEEISRLREEGDARLNYLQNYYRNTKYATEQNGAKDLRDLELNNQQNLEYTKKTGAENFTDINEQYLRDTAALASQYENKSIQLKSEQQRELDRKTKLGQTANELAEVKHQEEFEKLTNTHQEQLRLLEGNAGDLIEEIRQETADKLAAYRTRQNDPFYKLMDLGSTLSEDENGFTLRLTVPPHEQKNFSASVKGENLVVTGQRRNEESLTLENGVTQGTSSYQSYNESFPLSWPVDPGRLSKKFDGENVIIRVPKKNKYANEKSSVVHKAPLKAARFPQGIQEFYADKQAKTGAKKPFNKKSPSSGPLT